MDLGTFSSPGKRKRKATLSRHLHAHREGGSTKVSIYRKPAHTDYYLNFNPNYYLKYKRSVVRTLFLRAATIITDDRPWMFSIPPKTANTSSTKSEVVSIRAHSFSLPYTCKGFQKTGSQKFSKTRSWHIPQAFQDHQAALGPPQRSDTQRKKMRGGVRNSV